METGAMVADSSVFIEYLRAKDKSKTTLYSIADNPEIYVSSITIYELHMGASSPEKKNDIQLLTGDLIVLPFSNEDALKAASIYHQLKKENSLIEFRDIFIASTCLVNHLPIKTTNKKHFIRIKGLKIL